VFGRGRTAAVRSSGCSCWVKVSEVAFAWRDKAAVAIGGGVVGGGGEVVLEVGREVRVVVVGRAHGADLHPHSANKNRISK
jgi:hypothetical protein